MIYLLTGSPGSGKTLSAIEWMERVQAENPGRRIYAANIDGLTFPGVLPLDDDGVLRWHEVCEKDSIIFVDEAQRYWRAQRSGDPSQAIIEMETHRHDGIDIVLMTQHPTFIHANIRKLVNVHVHLIAFSKSSALRYEWRECHDDVQDNSLRQTGEFKEWSYPSRLYQFYKSATLHTKRAKRPLRMVIARVILWVLAVAFVCGLATVGVLIWRGSKAYQAAKSTDSIVGASVVSSGDSGVRRAGRVGMTAAEFAQAQVPRIPTQPYSAPIYDGQAVTQHPRIWCIAVEPPNPCRCITEQGTRYILDDRDCRNLASGGAPYDPYLPDRRDRDRDRDWSTSSRDSTVLGVSSSGAGSSSAVLAGIPAPSGAPVGVGGDYVSPQYGQWNADPFGGKSGN